MTKINTTTAPTSRDLGNPTPVPLAGIALDPNNPRIAPNPAPGYENAKAIFADEIQAALVKLVYKTYNAGELEDSIIDQGWTPVDQIIVWPHPSGKGFIVVEGNTRVSLLKQLPGRLAEEEKKLARMRKAPAPNSQTRAQEILIGKIETLIAETATLWVRPVLAKDAAELMEKLPRLLGVRHVVPAKSWKPYATNLYVISLYESAYARKHGPDEPLRIEREILDRVAEQLPLKREDIRRQIQAVSAFTQFKLNYEDKIVEAGNKLDGRDQYYFDNILKSPHARVAFDFKPDDLELSEEAEEALFMWAFSKPRGGAGGDDEEAVNENVFQKAEDIRLWQKVARYDASDGMGVTNFANRLDIQKPEGATPVWRLEREAASHRERNTPVKAFDELLKGLKDLKLDTLLMQAEHLRPMLAEARKQVDRYIKVIDQNTDDK